MYLHFVNAIGIFSILLILTVAVESPNQLLKEGKYDEARRNLNKISRVNHFFRGGNAYQFDGSVLIFVSKQDMAEYQRKYG
jgi:hypothetical protein